MCVPLTDMLKKGQPTKFVFNERQRDAFNLIKERLISSTELYTPDPNKPYVLHCDASEYAIGACLSQINDEGQECPIGFMSKKLSDCQRRWSPVEREAFAVVHALNYFDVLVYGCHIDVYTAEICYLWGTE